MILLIKKLVMFSLVKMYSLSQLISYQHLDKTDENVCLLNETKITSLTFNIFNLRLSHDQLMTIFFLLWKSGRKSLGMKGNHI